MGTYTSNFVNGVFKDNGNEEQDEANHSDCPRRGLL